MSTLHHRFLMLLVLIALIGLACNLAGGGTPAPGNSSMITSDPSMLRELRWVDGSRFAYFGKAGSGWELRIRDVDGTNHAFIDTITGEVLAFDFTS